MSPKASRWSPVAETTSPATLARRAAATVLRSAEQTIW